jgi:hypothetical protein
MTKPATILNEIKAAVKARKSESGEVNAVAQVLALYGHTRKPDIQEGRSPDGATIRVYIHEDTPAGSFLHVSGPSIIGSIETLTGPAAKSLADAGIYVQGRDAKGKTVSGIMAGYGRAASRTTRATEPAPAPKPKTRAPRAPRKPRAPSRPPLDYRAPMPSSAPRGRVSREVDDAIYEPIVRPAPRQPSYRDIRAMDYGGAPYQPGRARVHGRMPPPPAPRSSGPSADLMAALQALMNS